MFSSKRSAKLLRSKFKSTRGSAPLNFVLIAVPLLLLAFSVVGISLTTLLRNQLIDTAVESARFAALADQSSSDGCLRARALLAKTVAQKLDLEVRCFGESVFGVSQEVVQLTFRTPAIGFLPGSKLIKAVGHATREIQ